MAEVLRVGDPPILVRLRRDARARRLVLRVPKPGQDPTLTVPRQASMTTVAAFLRDQDAWLRDHLDRLEPRVAVGWGCVLPFRGGQLAITGGARVLHQDGWLAVPGASDRAGPQVARFLQEAARRICTDAARVQAARLDRTLGRISLRDPRSRWGSCSAAGDLMFSWRLVMAPASVLDYVIAHEVAHLAELNHSDRFWRHVRGLCPDCEAARLWLRRHGAELHAYDFASSGPGV